MSSANAQKNTKPASGRGRLIRGGLALAMLSACAFAMFAATDQPSLPTRPLTQTEPPVKLLSAVEVIEVAPVDLTEQLHLTGEVKALRHVSLSAQVAGLAGDVSHMPGDSVTMGDLLLSIAPDDYRLALASAEAEHAGLLAQIEMARSTHDRTRRLSQSGASSGATLEQAESAVAVLEAGIAAAKIGVAQARLNLERASIHAPISGKLASRAVEPGQLIQSGDVLFEIVDLDSVTVEAMIPVGQAARLTVGQAAELWAPEAPAARIKATVTRIAPRTVSGTRSVSVWLGIDNSRAGLPVGSFLRGEVTLRRASGRLALPPAAIREDGTVLTIREDRVVPVAVVFGDTWDGGALVEVSGDLRQAERIVALPLIGLDPGDVVEIAGE